MATVGKMVAVLSARTAKFQSSMKRSAKAARRLGRAVRGAARFVARIGAVAGAAALGGLALIVKENLKSIDTLAKLSRNLQVSIDDLQAFRLAASIAGIEQGKFDKALKKLTKSLSDAGRGLSTQVDAFRALGLSVEELKGLNVADAFRKIADAVKRTGVTVEVTGALMDLFGAKVGADMVELLRRGAEGLDSFKQEINDLGLSLSAVDAAKVEAANDAWTRFKGILKAVAQKITVELAPFIEAAVVAMTNWGKEGTTAGEAIANAVGFAVKFIAKMATAIQVIIQLWRGLKVAALEYFTLIADAAQRLVAKYASYGDPVFDAVSKRFLILEGQLFDARKKLDKGFDALSENPWADRIREGYESIKRAAEEAAREATEFQDAVPEPEVIEPARKKVEELAEEIKQVVEPTLEMDRPERPGRFGEGDLALRGIGGPVDREAETQKQIKEILERMLDISLNPPPMELAWSGR